MDKSLLSVSNLCFSYGEKPLLDNISFEINAGEYVSVIGVNGCGKSTLLSLIASQQRPQSGKIIICKNDITALTPLNRARLVGYIPQGGSVAFSFTCLEAVLMGLRPHKGVFSKTTESDLQSAKNVMLEMGIWQLRDRCADTLSGGETQRLLLARALLQAPKLLLLDEATGELDVAAKLAVIKKLREKATRDNLAVLAVNHDLSSVYRFSDRVIAISNGKIAAVGTPNEVFIPEFFERVFSVKATVIEGKGFIIDDILNKKGDL